MNKLVKLLISAMVLASIYAPSCSDQDSGSADDESRLNQSIDSISETFGSSILDDWEFDVFERKAKQKLADFADYLNVLSDTTIDMVFREKSGELIRKMFISKDVVLHLSRPQETDGVDYHPDQLVSAGLSNKLDFYSCALDSVSMNHPFKKINSFEYITKFNFDLNARKGKSNSIPTFTRIKNIQVFLLNETKVIGNHRISTWNVKLGDIN